MKHLWTIICQKAIVDNETKNISLMDVLEKISFTTATELHNGKTAFPFKFEIISYWMRESESEKYVEYSIETIDPSGKKIIDKEYKMDFPLEGKMRMRSIIKSNAFIFTSDGQYLFRVKMKNRENYKIVAEIPIEVKFQKMQETQETK